MSTYAGVLLAAVALGTPSASITPDLAAFTVPPVAGIAARVTDVTAGALHGSGVVVIWAPASVGATSPDRVGPAGDWFERIWLRVVGGPFGRPLAVDVGQVVSDVDFTVELWNAYRGLSRTLSAITGAGDGIVVADPDGEPLVFLPLRSRLYVVTVQEAGAAVVDGHLTWDFAGIGEPVLAVTGTRVVLVPFEPDWSNGITESEEWLTDVQVGRDGTEQRIALRSLFRRQLTYRFLTVRRPQDAARLDLLLYGRSTLQLAVPLWTSRVPLGSAVGVGDTVLAIDTVDREFTAGESVMLWRDAGTWEVATVGAVADDHLTVSALKQSWAAPGTAVVPLKFARLPASYAYQRPKWGVIDATLEFLVEAVP